MPAGSKFATSFLSALIPVSLLLILTAPLAARAQLPNYQWVGGHWPPSNAVTAPDSPNSAVCRGNASYGRLWTGYWDGRNCIVFGPSAPAEAVQSNLQFLAVVSGTTQWVSGTGKRLPGDIGNLPANAIVAGNNYQGQQMVVCSWAGYTSWVSSNLCNMSRAGPDMTKEARVLVGLMIPIYTWTTAAAPPANAVTAPDAPHSAVCRGNDQYGSLWAGYWNGTQCIGADGGNQEIVTARLQFLTVVSGVPQWPSGSGKRVPGDIGNLPANTVNAGNTQTGLAQILCSQGGYVGWVYSNTCSIYPAPSMQVNATVLVGLVQ